MFLNKLTLLALFSLLPFGPRPAKVDFNVFCKRFVDGYKELKITDLSLSYVENFKSIKSAGDVDKQVMFFTHIKQELAIFDPKQLTLVQSTDYQLISYETGINLERLSLEKQWVNSRPVINDKGLNQQVNGKLWYAYFLKKWVADDVTPDQIFQFGLKEVARVKGNIEKVRQQTGLSEDEFYKHLNDPSFFIKDPKEVRAAFANVKGIINSHLDSLFTPQLVPDVMIKKGENANLAQTPGYYDNNTFYYNLFDKPYNKRQVDWLFIHEAIPGHHYQLSINNKVAKSAVQQLFYYLGFSEGWGAYAEELGKQLGVYKTSYDELGKWEWDIVRSVRVPLDVGINYYGWTDEQALAYWKKNIRNQDDIAMREIARVKRWPAQVVTYKYGAAQIMEWKAILQKRQGAKFNIRNFHDRVLMHGSLPLFMVKKNVLG
jgi:uncharacterized protein (DUF885 family)